jgi:mono/diheme cytochrome c family protein
VRIGERAGSRRAAPAARAPAAPSCRRRPLRRPWLWRAALACAVLCGGAAAAAQTGALRLPEGPGADLVYARCRTCHDLQYVLDARGLSTVQWRAVIDGMKDYGLSIDAKDEERVLGYLAAYLGSGPAPVARVSAAVSGGGREGRPDGGQLFERNCASCHGADGRGRPGYYPPLANNPDLAMERAFPVLVVLHGLSGAIEVGGSGYDGAMPAFDQLSDAEIAAVVDYVRTAWQGRPAQAATTTPASVATMRAQPMTPEAVREYRAAMTTRRR